jgi:F-box protein 18 (helicase)
MKLTEEQETILDHNGHLRINAFAGTGKTTTLLEYAKRHSTRSILYIAFNRAVKEEAIKRFAYAGLDNVRIETAHSLAYHGTNARRYTISPGLKVFDIPHILNLQTHSTDSLYYFILSKHILKWLTGYLNSDLQSANDFDYLQIVRDKKALAFAKSNLSHIERYAVTLLLKMFSGETDMLHDGYLKQYHLCHPQLDYDIILFDEGQDASPVMLDIFLTQSATKVIVGDEHQQIYGFRHAVNSLQRVDFDKLYLTRSFRFRQDIADLAKEVLFLKEAIGYDLPEVRIIGAGHPDREKTYAVLARSNIGLLAKAIEMVFINKIHKVYFEGNINSYIFSSEGTSIYDVLNLSLNQKKHIRNQFIRCFNSFEDLKEYTDEAEDRELDLIAQIVQTYGTDLFAYLPALKSYQTRREDASIIFSTLHKAKGMEYDLVELADDFVTDKEVYGIIEREEDIEPWELEETKEEINMLYVALTRAKNKLYAPKSLLKTANKILRQSKLTPGKRAKFVN